MNKNLDLEKKMQRKISKILLTEWDPIGIQDIPEAHDEYYSYVFEVYQMLISNKSEIDIFDHLWWIETKHMGLLGNNARTKLIAKMLFELNEKNK